MMRLSLPKHSYQRYVPLCLGLALLCACQSGDRNPTTSVPPSPVPYTVSGQVFFPATPQKMAPLQAAPEAGMYEAGEYLVQWQQGKQPPQQLELAGQRLEQEWSVHSFGLAAYKAVGGGLSALSATQSQEVLQALQQQSGVQHVSASKRLNTQALTSLIPNDALWPKQWDAEIMNFPQAWAKTTGASGLVIAVLDTGIVAHPDLAGQYLRGLDAISDPRAASDGDGVDQDPTDSDPQSDFHGTHVAGILAAKGNNVVGRAGAIWGAKLLPVRVLSASGGSGNDIMRGLLWAAGVRFDRIKTKEGEALPEWVFQNPNPARIINMSLGGESDCDPISAMIFEQFARDNIFVVAAAGNKGKLASAYYPANCNNVITVGAVNAQKRKPLYSNFGPAIDIMAAGGGDGTVQDDKGNFVQPTGIWSTVRNPVTKEYDYLPYSGTSMAAPQVAGALGLLLSLEPQLSYAQGLARLKAAATPIIGCPPTDCGAGLLDVAKLLEGKSSSVPVRPTPTPTPPTTTTPVTPPTTKPSTFPFTVFAFDSNQNPIARQVFAYVKNPTAYSLRLGSASRYTLYAWQDLNGNRKVDLAEPLGTVSTAELSPSNSTISGLNITLQPATSAQLTKPMVQKMY